MSQDRMSSVFPIEFDFAEGEEPTAVKLSGFVKLTRTAFNEISVKQNQYRILSKNIKTQ